MSKNFIKIVAVVLAMLAGPLTGMARADDQQTDDTIDAVLGDHAAYHAAFDALQAAVEAKDVSAVAALVRYPISVSIGGKSKVIANAKDFAANYDAIFTPSITAAVTNQTYADLFVNSQGIMFGRGEVWINGICKDDGCKEFDAKVVTIQPGPEGGTVAAAPAAPQKAGVLKTFKDWKVGCDNARNCVALGLSADADALSGYLKLSRAGDAEAVPEVAFTTWPEDENVKVSEPSVKLSLEGNVAGGVPADALPAELDGDVVSLKLSPAAVAELLLALRSATAITMELLDSGKSVSSQTISLAGSSAALLYMDDEQKRIGTVTALAKPGSAGADTIPPVPALPVVTSLPVTDMADPLPKAPRTAAKPSSDCGDGPSPYVAFQLPGGASLWGACASAGAYNYAYEFRLFVGGKPGRPWSYTVPGVKPDDPAWLWNAYVDNSSKTLNSFMKGRGLGDCGDATEWAFDGKDFAALTYQSMDDCRGVMQEDWPVLYRAEKG